MDILITGGANGIGKATAEQLLEKGHTVIVYDRDSEALQDLPDDIKTIQADVYDRETVQQTIDDHEFSVLINCAGHQALGAVEDVEPDELEEHFRSNLFGAWNTIQAALPMLREKNGRIINISSLAGYTTAPFWGAYSASKHALEAMSDALRMELHDQPVDIIIVEPGPVRTGFNERGRDHLETFLPDSFYAEKYEERLREAMGGITPERCARNLVQIIETDSPRPRYRITRLAKLGVLLQYLPTRVQDWIIRNQY